MWHPNIIAIKDLIISEKVREEKMLLEGIENTTAPAEVALVSSLVDLTGRYNWAMSDADLDIAKKLGLISIKKYWKRAS